jgi:hypothetical protein
MPGLSIGNWMTYRAGLPLILRHTGNIAPDHRVSKEHQNAREKT